MKKFALVMIAFMNFAFAGNGSSGGGSIYADRVNPWFFQNTPTVRYCIKTAPDFAKISSREVEVIIDNAFEFWKKEFKKVRMGHYFIKPQVELATQDFYLTKCDDKVDIVFQLGIISEEQKKQIHNFSSVIGIAFRESYDEINLRGRGFIYLAAEKGPLRPVSENFADAPWSEVYENEHLNLYMSLVHEIGHVFGLQDEFQGDHYSDLMSASFVEAATSKVRMGFGSITPYSPLSTPATFYTFATTSLRSQPIAVKEFLGMKEGDSALIRGFGDRIVLEKNNDSDSESGEQFGTIRIDNVQHKQRHQVYTTKVRMWLPPQQKVFTVNWTPNAVNISYFDILRTLSSFALIDQEYRRQDGVKQKVDLYFGAWYQVTIGASIDGTYNHDLLHHYSPSK